MPLRFNDNGRLDLSSVDELSRDELREWIRARLHSEDTRVPDDPKQDIGQYYLVGAIYDELQPETQESIRDILEEFLLQMKNGDEAWQGRPAHTLLLLVMEIGDPDFVKPVRRMAEQETVLERDEPDEDLHARLLQTLLELGEEMDPEFWTDQLDLNASRYVIYAFAGLRTHSLYQALGIVPQELNLENDDLRSTFYSEIRGLLASEQYTQDRIQEVISDMREILQDEGIYELVCTALPELDLPDSAEQLGDDDPSAEAYRMSRSVLGQQGYEPRYEELRPPELD